jgi:biopolymer transport protein ExbD
MIRSIPDPEPRPIIEMNTTPLIDVLLVLLVMFIITIPIQTHAIKLDLPQPCSNCPQLHPIKNLVEISKAGTLSWNGVPVGQDQLRALLQQSVRLRPAPELHLRPDAEARYEIVDQVLAAIKREHVQKVGFVGNEKYVNL